METVLISVAILLICSVLASKVSGRFGIPVLLLFLLLGMLAGSEGLGGIYFDDAQTAQFVGVASLVLILFSGGLDTDWKQVRPVLREGILLSTLGVLITAGIVGFFTHRLLGFSLLESFLLGAIVSSTDAAAVFSILRSSGIHLKGRLQPLLELESGSNDPMAIFLTTSLIQLSLYPGSSISTTILSFFMQMILGVLMGLGLGWLLLHALNHIRLDAEGLYPVFSLAFAFFIFSATQWMGGNGFLAVYLAAIYLNQHTFIHKKSLLRFHDGLAWLMQIAMFLTLGLLVFPSHLAPVVTSGLLLAVCLMFVARPVGIFLCLSFNGMTWKEKTLVAWSGLRGAVPIILATYPLLAGMPLADIFFNLVFFVVLASVLFQGTSIPYLARLLQLDAPAPRKRVYPLELNPMGNIKNELKELVVESASNMDGRSIVDLRFPPGCFILLVARGNDFVIPNGSTVLKAGDTLLLLTEEGNDQDVHPALGQNSGLPALGMKFKNRVEALLKRKPFIH